MADLSCANRGAEYPREKRNGFQAFNADKSVHHSDNVNRCFGCHKGQERQDLAFTPDRMKTAK